MSIKSVPLSQVLDFIRGITFKPEDKVVPRSQGSAICMRTKNIQVELEESDVLAVPEKFIKRDEQYLEEGDLLISSANSWELVGKAVRVPKLNYKCTAGGFISILRPIREQVDPDYLFRFIMHKETQHKIRHLGRQTTNISNLDRKRFLKLEIPLPSLPVQKQIAAALEKADTLRGQCQQMEQELNTLAQSVFLDMFGDPVTNPKGWKTEKLNNLVSICSGATPSKSNELFWKGKFPWVSPKDMKYNYIIDSIDHVSEIVFEETNLKRIDDNTILIVVRGMILVHTVPIAITKANVSINQDIKALKVVHDEVEPVYLLWCLKSQHDHILSKVSTAAHGTKRLDMPDLIGLNVTIPRKEMQQKFCRLIETLDEQLRFSKAAVKSHDGLFNSLMQRAFKGELTLKDIA
ncbi:restriction endonuclease subunit S [Psychrobium sp. nBUS_13]|uniref:restriction endonuclease subunit S n=1 Tax=Psychrobium sp. nBUS_13 TaxID=3395319 RepID=UPI003EC04AFB